MTIVVGRKHETTSDVSDTGTMAVGDSGLKTITLLIKTPNQAREDEPVEGVCLDWTVNDLKRHLSTFYTTKPAVSEQRLIYAGKLLPDQLLIRDLFRPTRETEQPRPSMAASALPDPSGPSSTVQTPRSPKLRQRRQTSSSSSSSHTRTPESPPGTAFEMPGAPPMTPPAFPTYSLYSPEQLLWLQHVYARQYYMQCHAAMVAAGTAPSAPAATVGRRPPVHAHPVPVPDPLANQNPINDQNPAREGAFVNPGEANQNMRMNAQGGPVMDEGEDVERDWLDWLYSAVRFSVLLIIVYFNSSLSRFLLVMSALLLMYLHTVGWFPFRRRAQVQGPDHLQPPVVQNNQQHENRNPPPVEEDGDGQRVEPAAAEDGSHGQGPAAAVLVPPHRLSVMWTFWVFLRAFLSSLIPEVPQGIAN
ncbi:homocysteine-responsive endoplasmic reticulum-resident ubiquitin-like domain member 1 protein isoform X2 [Cebidichthys violaceus]|uniref:homocysteine-responsive endoplasmic reticulum-resident ubiquitin-like domain member 1 protein isoform X2 n=1 Tax=Cebidichthys violaceus TaxID=271503 RepID=UPI0035CB6023